MMAGEEAWRGMRNTGRAARLPRSALLALLATRPLLVLLLLLIPLIPAAGCGGGGYVWVQQDKYQPNLPSMDMYRGHLLRLGEFAVRATNTTRGYYYYSPDRSMVYEASPDLPSYLRDVFRKALESQGMKILDEPLSSNAAASAVPELGLVVTFWNDEELRFKVTLAGSQEHLLEKDYSIVWEASGSSNPEVREQQAYRMLDAAVAALLIDPAFRAALLGPG